MDETVKTTSEVNTLTYSRLLHISQSDYSKTPYIPKINGNKINSFRKEWSTK